MDRRDFIKKATMAAAGAAVVSPVSAMLNNVTDGKTPKVLLINGSPSNRRQHVLLPEGDRGNAAEAWCGIGDRSDWPQARPHVHQLRRLPTERR